MNKSLLLDINGAIEKEEKQMTIKSLNEKGHVIISLEADKAVVSIEDLKKALKEIEKFQRKN